MRWLAMILTLLFGLTACGGDGGEVEAGGAASEALNQAPAEGPATATPTPAVAPTAPPAPGAAPAAPAPAGVPAFTIGECISFPEQLTGGKRGSGE